MFLIAAPDHPHYLWQTLVQMHQMRGEHARWLFYCPEGHPSSILAGIIEAGVADITCWPDWERDMTYHAAMKPWLVGKWLSASRFEGPVTVIDPDVIPTGKRLPDPRSGLILATDTDSYTGPAWLDSKGALEPLCELVGVDPHEARRYRGVGAQYTFQGIDGIWWQDVARLSIDAYALLKGLPEDAQPWCAEMYVTWLAAIRDGIYPTKVERMGMVWADGKVSGWHSEGFFHDAGIAEPREGAFHKGSFQTWPRNIPPVDKKQAASRYVDLIHETERDWPELVALFT